MRKDAPQPEMGKIDEAILVEFHAHQGGDQESAQEEENGNADPARNQAAQSRVRKEHQQKTDRADAIERRHVTRRRRMTRRCRIAGVHASCPLRCRARRSAMATIVKVGLAWLPVGNTAELAT